MDNQFDNTDVTDSADLTERLKDANKLAIEAAGERRARQVKGAHLTEPLRQRAVDAGATVEEKSGFYKITKVAKGPAIYLALKGGRVDLSGLTVEAPGVRQISEQDARERHLGKVRGQLDFDQTDEILFAAFDQALEQIMSYVAPERPVRVPRPAKAPKVEVKIETTGDAAAPADVVIDTMETLEASEVDAAG